MRKILILRNNAWKVDFEWLCNCATGKTLTTQWRLHWLVNTMLRGRPVSQEPHDSRLPTFPYIRNCNLYLDYFYH